MNRKIVLWSLALFFGSSLVFQAIDQAAADSGRGVSLGLQAAALVAIIVAVVLVVRRSSK